MSESKLLVEIALKELNVNQKKLAELLGVSTGQISRWKNHGDYISFELREKLAELSGVHDLAPELVLLTGSLVMAQQWEKVIRYGVLSAAEDNETGFVCAPLEDYEESIIPGHLADLFNELGVSFYGALPSLVEDFCNGKEFDDETWEKFYETPQIELLSKLLTAYTEIHAFHTAYLEEMTSYNDDVYDLTSELEDHYFHLAACKIEIDPKIAPNKSSHDWKWKQWYAERIADLKKIAVEKGTPLREELLKLLDDKTHKLNIASDAALFGFNNTKIHPDIYMNEILLSLRIINRVLPAIVKKLGIEDEIDFSDLGD